MDWVIGSNGGLLVVIGSNSGLLVVNGSNGLGYW